MQMTDPAAPFQALQHALPGALVLLDAADRVAAWSPAAERWFGTPASSALGRPAAEVGLPGCDVLAPVITRVRAGGEPERTPAIRMPGAAARFVEFIISRFDASPEGPSANAVSVDAHASSNVERSPSPDNSLQAVTAGGSGDVLLFARDVTDEVRERRAADARLAGLERRAAESEALRGIAVAAASSLNPDEIFGALCERVRGLFQADMTAVDLPLMDSRRHWCGEGADPDALFAALAPHLRTVCDTGATLVANPASDDGSPPDDAMTSATSSGDAGSSADSVGGRSTGDGGGSVDAGVSGDAGADAFAAHAGDGSAGDGGADVRTIEPVDGLDSAVIVPLRADGEVPGALLVGWRHGPPVASDTVRLARTLAAEVALAFRNARMYDSMKEAAVRRDRFFSAMSHDLRTPITAIVGYSELLQDGIVGELEARQLEMVERISQVAGHLSQLVNDILDLAKLDAGRMEFHLEEVPLGDLVEEAVVTVRPQAQGKSLALRLEIDGHRGTRMRVDPPRVRQILVNLLSNAVKFTEAGEVAVSVGIGDEQGWIEVRDTGPGLPADSEEVVFEEFLQIASGNKAKREPGSGLGLAISRRLARAMGGDLTARSGDGSGAVFTLYLPFSEA
jgi:signal transduction histidine kinase